jgi:hypothetical protein
MNYGGHSHLVEGKPAIVNGRLAQSLISTAAKIKPPNCEPLGLNGEEAH